LTNAGVQVRIVDIGAFPEHMRITLGEAIDHIEIDGERLRPGSVYVRDLGLNPAAHSDLDDEMTDDWRRTMAAIRERADFIMSIVYRWELAGIPIYNPLSAFPKITKPYQLALLQNAGLPVPRTRWTNDPETVRQFAAEHSLIYKPVAGGAETKQLQPGDMSEERLEMLRAAPVCFQALLPGKDIRVYVIDGKIVASIRIETDSIDFRQHELALEQFELDDATRQVCVRATEVLGLRFTGMDLKANARGELEILELNPSPMFLGFDERSGSNILGALCDALARTA
jgi:glutathione synthase/RimK-type ligase-like ATP-grasp enzyme